MKKERNPYLVGSRSAARGRSRWRLAVATVCFVAVFALVAWFLAVRKGVFQKFAAKWVDSHGAVYFAYISNFETPGDLSKSVLGFGFAGKLNKGLIESGATFYRCRQFFLQTSPKASFEVKVLPSQSRLKVVALLQGADSNGPHAACLRDAMEDLQLPFLMRVPEGKDNQYRLVIDVVSQINAPIPLN